VNDTGGVHVFQSSLQVKVGFLWDNFDMIETHQDLIQEILNKLFFQRPAGQQAMEIRSQQFGDEIDIFKGRNKNIGESDDVLVLDVLEELEFSIGALGENRSREWLHNLLDGDGCAH